MLFAAVRWSLLAHSGHSRHCNILSAIGEERTLTNRWSSASILGWQGSAKTAERACNRFTLLPLNPAEIPQSFRGLCRLCPVRLFLHAGQCRTALPEQYSRSVVLGPRRRRSLHLLVKVLSRRFGHVWRGREIDNRFCALNG